MRQWRPIDGTEPEKGLWHMELQGVQPRLALWLGDVNGRLECIGLEVGGKDGTGSFSTALLRDIKLATFVDEARASILAATDIAHLEDLAATVPDIDLERTRAFYERTQRFKDTPRKKGRPALSDEYLQDVAAFWSHRSAIGSSPTKDVAEYFHLSRSAAAHQVSEARKRGYLDPPDKKKGGRPSE